ncbi:MAG TPA: hypothetical protein PLK30_14635 [Blastocatellia bacterium]|nr:hypothetical protein [Blastocatellia bacterium]
MKPQSKLFALSMLAGVLTASALFNSNSVAMAFQQGPSRGSIAAPRDPEQEKQSYKSLDAAKFYFYKRKPVKGDKDGVARLNKAVLDRLQEILDLNPGFGRIDEVYFLMGEVHQRGGDIEQAVEFWTKAAKEGSDEKIKAEAQKRLDEVQNQKKKG